MEALKTDRDKGGHVLSALMVTDIVAGAPSCWSRATRAAGARVRRGPADGAMSLPGVMSRKKQVAPKLLRAASGRASAMEPLDALVGEWDVAIVNAALGGEPVRGRSSFAWILDGAYLVQRTATSTPTRPTREMIVAPGAGDGEYVQHYFDARGVSRIYAMTFGDGRWTLLRDAPDFSELAFAQRFVGDVDGDVIRGRWETAPEPGAPWELDFELTYTRRAG